jgi:hypothetical protein
MNPLAVGALVRSKVTAQGMVKGETYRVVDTRTTTNITGRYTTYVLVSTDATRADRRLAVGNGHLLLEVL